MTCSLLFTIAAIGMNRFWRTSSKLRALAAKYVDLSPLIHRLFFLFFQKKYALLQILKTTQMSFLEQAQHLRHLFMESCGANDDDSFICVVCIIQYFYFF